MSLEKPVTTRRQEWDAERDETQANVDALLADIALDIEGATLAINHYVEAQEFDRAHKIAQDTIEKLNERWEPYLNSTFLVSGRWYESVVEPTANGISVRLSEEDAFEPRATMGFTAKVFQNKEGHFDTKIGLLFEQGHFRLPMPNFNAVIQPFDFAELSDINLQYLRPIGQERISADTDDVIRRLNQADSLLRVHLRNEHSNFYNISAKKQRKFFREVQSSFDEALPDERTKDYVLLEDAKISMAFIRHVVSRIFSTFGRISQANLCN